MADEIYGWQALDRVLDCLASEAEKVLERANVFYDYDNCQAYDLDTVSICEECQRRDLSAEWRDFDGGEGVFCNDCAPYMAGEFADERRHEEYVKSIR